MTLDLYETIKVGILLYMSIGAIIGLFAAFGHIPRELRSTRRVPFWVVLSLKVGIVIVAAIFWFPAIVLAIGDMLRYGNVFSADDD
jgi:hypothetical protein